MRRPYLWLLTVSLASGARADEYYEFFQFECIPQPSFASISPVGIWNIHEVVWPSAPESADPKAQRMTEWELHERGLKELEDRHGLYVFGEAYGRYEDQPAVCSTDKFRLTAAADPISREFGPPGLNVEYRGPMKVTIQSPEGAIYYEGQLETGSSLQTDGVDLTICVRNSYEYPKYQVRCEKRWLDPKWSLPQK